ncbi:MAG: sporulation integral membrane protein YlbJ, partial [Desulfotomaculaceae bacterium]|nr:sporulation integral membrane protein YlbJ [Desulfotomaculaceae bacterium]
MVVAALGLSLILLVLLRKKYISRKEAFRLLWTICAVIFVVSMIFYPRTTFDGAVFGLKTWWNIVFPALLPFFISSEL